MYATTKLLCLKRLPRLSIVRERTYLEILAKFTGKLDAWDRFLLKLKIRVFLFVFGDPRKNLKSAKPSGTRPEKTRSQKSQTRPAPTPKPSGSGRVFTWVGTPIGHSSRYMYLTHILHLSIHSAFSKFFTVFICYWKIDWLIYTYLVYISNIFFLCVQKSRSPCVHGFKQTYTYRFEYAQWS